MSSSEIEFKSWFKKTSSILLTNRLPPRLIPTRQDDLGSVSEDDAKVILRRLAAKLVERAHGPENIDLSSFLLEASRTLFTNARRLSLIQQPAADCFVSAEQAQQIGLLAFEVIQNAIDYAHPTGLIVCVTSECRRSPDGRIVVSISDDGVGLPDDMDPYREGGTGFRRIRALAKDLRAKIRIESDPLGSTFTVTLPKTVEHGEATIGATHAHDRITDGNGTSVTQEKKPDLPRNMFAEPSELDRASELQQFLAAIIESSDDAILSKNLDGIITSWNAGCERLFGYTAQEAIGRSVTMLMPEDRLHEEPSILARLRRGEKIDHYETVRRRKDGSLVDISLTVSPIRGPNGTIVGASKVARDITERKRAAAQRELLLGEMRHRVKNLSAVIEALARQSRPRDEPAVEAFVDVFMGRVRALLSTGELMLGSTERNVELRQLLERVLVPFVDNDKGGRFVFDGPTLILREKTAGSLGLAVHELATNAIKYGALKAPQGRVQIEWSVEPSGDARRVSIAWRERGGEPIADAPAHSGFGSRVVASAVAGEKDGTTEVHFEPGGLYCKFQFTM